MDLNQPMSKIREILGGYSVRTRLSLTGTLVVARDIAHAKLQERIDEGKGLPEYIKDHIIYYAGIINSFRIRYVLYTKFNI